MNNISLGEINTAYLWQTIATIDESYYPNDGNPERFVFRNSQDLLLQAYIWYPSIHGKFQYENVYNIQFDQSPMPYIETSISDYVYAKGIILLIHGFGSHARFGWLNQKSFIEIPDSHNYMESNPKLKYEKSWIQKFNALGYIVAAIDLQGHGLSQGWENQMGNVRYLDDMPKDILQYIFLLNHRLRSIRQHYKLNDNPPLNIYLIGSSLGGWVSARALQLINQYKTFENALPFIFNDTMKQDKHTPIELSGCILLSPMLDLSHIVSSMKYKVLKPALDKCAKWLPHFIVSSNTPDLHYPEEDILREQDRYVIKSGTRARMAYEVLYGTQCIHDKENQSLDHPCTKALLILHNIHDTQCGIQGTFDFYKNISGIQDKTFYAIDGLQKISGISIPDEILTSVKEEFKDIDIHHNLCRDPDNHYIFEYIKSWINSRV